MDVWRAGRTWKITVGEVRISPDNLNSICNGEAEGECQYRASNWNNDDQKRHLFIPFCKCIYDSIYIYISKFKTRMLKIGVAFFTFVNCLYYTIKSGRRNIWRGVAKQAPIKRPDLYEQQLPLMGLES